MASPDTTRGAGGPTGWAVFAGVILVILGFLNFFWGLAAILEDQNVIVGGNGVIITDLTAWGWATRSMDLAGFCPRRIIASNGQPTADRGQPSVVGLSLHWKPSLSGEKFNQHAPPEHPDAAFELNVALGPHP